MKIFFQFFCLGLSQLITNRNACPKIPVIADFDTARYKGLWYEQARYNNQFQNIDSKCVTATYGDRDATSVSVNNTEIVPVYEDETTDFQWKYTWLTGKGVQTYPEDHPNRLLVSFYNISAPAGGYDVMETDYENYALVMSCRQLATYTIEYAWILARDQMFRDTPKFGEVQAMGKEKFNLQPEVMVEANQVDCDYDFVEECDQYICG